MLIKAAFHTGVWTIVFFILGMIKPKWPLFFLKKPDRFMVLVISTVLFMISATMFGEGNRRLALEENSAKETVHKIMDATPVPVPVPVPDTPTPKQETPKN